MSDQPNAVRASLSVLRSLFTKKPRPTTGSTLSVDHTDLTPVLDDLRVDGVGALVEHRSNLSRYRDQLAGVDPDTLDRSEALAYWLNLYNAGALGLAAVAAGSGESSVLRVPGAFSAPWANVAGKSLSLNQIEHGKVRRFKDPRIHAALVCGSASCPTLRFEPYTADRLEDQLDDQMRSFVRAGAATVDHPNGVYRLSRIFLWYGADFVWPQWMPALLPAGRRSIATATAPWLDEVDRTWLLETKPRIAFLDYDWGLSCSVA